MTKYNHQISKVGLCTLFILPILLLLNLSSCRFTSGDHDIQEGVKAYNAQDYEKALTHFKAALMIDVYSIEKEKLYTHIGNTYLGLEEPENAILYLNIAIEFNQKYVPPRVGLGLAHRMLGEYDLAEKEYLQALELDAKDVACLSSLGTLKIIQDEPQNALDYLDKAIVLDPDNAIAHGNRAAALGMLGEYEKAMAEIVVAENLGYEEGEEMREFILESKNSK